MNHKRASKASRRYCDNFEMKKVLKKGLKYWIFQHWYIPMWDTCVWHYHLHFCLFRVCCVCFSSVSIHNWSLQTFCQDFGLASHVVCVNFICDWRLTSTPNNRFLRNFLMTVLFVLRAFARNLLRGNRRRNIFGFSFLMTALGYEPRLWGLISRLTTYYTTATSRWNIIHMK